MITGTPAENLLVGQRVHLDGEVWKVIGKPLFAEAGNGQFYGKSLKTGELKNIPVQRGETVAAE